MCPETHSRPNAKRVAAGKRNRLRRKGLTPKGGRGCGRQPFEPALAVLSGPKTARGKASSAANGKKRRKGSSPSAS